MSKFDQEPTVVHIQLVQEQFTNRITQTLVYQIKKVLHTIIIVNIKKRIKCAVNMVGLLLLFSFQ